MSTTQDAMSRQLEGAMEEQASRAADEAATFGGQSTEIGRQSREVPRWMRGRGPVRRNNRPDTSAPSRTQERQKARQQAAEKQTKKKKLSKEEQGRRLAQREYAKAGLRRRMRNKEIKKKDWIEALQRISAGKSNSVAVRDAQIELGLIRSRNRLWSFVTTTADVNFDVEAREKEAERIKAAGVANVVTDSVPFGFAEALAGDLAGSPARLGVADELGLIERTACAADA